MKEIKRTTVRELLANPSEYVGKEVDVKGWVRTRRGNKNVQFIALNDGSTIKNLQIVVALDRFTDDELLKLVTTGSAIHAQGPLVESQGKGQTVELLPILMGSASGVIGSSALGLILGGIYLLLRGGITWEIPTSMIATTWLFLVIFGGYGFDPAYILPQLLGGGLLMAAFFMATDPVSCPSTRDGQLVFGIFAGLLIGLFRVKGASPDSTTYAVLIADLVGPVIDDLIIPTPFGYRIPKERKKAIPKPVIILLVITLVAGLALSGVYVLTKDTIAENQALANKAALMEVLPEAADFVSDDDLQAKISAQGDTYGADFGGAKIESAAVGLDASGNSVGYAVTVFNSDSYDGGLTLVVGVKADGTVTGISFTELHDTAGMGMRIRSFSNSFEVAPMLLYIILIGIIGITSEKIIKTLERKLTGWQEKREV